MNSSKSWRTGSTQAGGRQATPDRLWVWMSGRRLARLPIGMVVVALLASLFGPLGRTVAGAAEGPAATAGSGSSSARLIVKLASGMSRDQQRQVVQRNGGTLVSEITRLSMVVISVPAAEASNHSKRYQADKQVRRVDANRSRKASAAPNDPAYAGQWALPKIGWDAARDTVAPAGSATIAVLDTGVAPVADLEGRLVPGYTAFPNTDPQVDANGHGTALATIAAAAADNSAGIAGVGYAAGVKVMPVRVLDDSGLGQDSDVIAGVVHAADNGADVILMGFSAPGFSQSLQDAVDYAWSKGAVLVAATGNAGSTEPTYPAGDAKVVGVSATDQNDGLWPSSNSGASAFLGAPGVEIGAVAPGGGTTSITGTSGSAAVVAGSAALLAANDSAASNGVIVGRLARNADAAGTADQTGNGRVNLARAIADTSTEAVVPAGAAPLGSGGPFVGPYVVAAGGGLTVSATFNVSTSSITGSISGGGDPNSQKFYQYSYTAPGASAPSFVSPCLAGAAGGSNTYFLPPGYTAGMWTVSVSRFNANDGGVCHVSRKDADGSITVSAAASIRGAALNDVDGDSSANDGAAPLVGATVTLYKAAVGTATARSSSDTTVGTSTSSSTGAYGFASGLVSGTYFLVRSNPASAGWFSTNAISGSGTGTSSSKVSNDEIRVVLSTTSASTTGNNFLAQQRNASISGTIFNDVNNNGVKDAGETGTVGGGTIGISGGTPPVSLTPLTVTAGGTYSFTGLQAGNYTLTYSAPSGYSPTGPNPQTITLSASESVTRDFLAHTNAAPVVDLNSATTGNDNTATFTEDGAAAALAGLATVVDADDTSLASATV
ncbi:MAG TPA: S8 family serine peptidase, partial [Acidimicrobiales bacterium]|nr:S8 family serine peptidase [Acidimicrobiales bacterium]